jgi:glycosyltransferase involved in cell wall biosynthesis
MKIGIDCRLWGETGVGRYIRNLIKELQVIDKENEYVLFVLSKDYDALKSQISNERWSIIAADIRWHSLKEQLEFPRTLNRENLDLMHFPYFSVPIFYNRPYVVTIHDLIQNHYASGHASTLPFFFYYIKRVGYKKVLGNAVKKAKKIIVPLACVKDDLVNTLGVSREKIVVTKEGFDPNIKKGKVSESVLKASKDPYFLYVGNAYRHKNLEALIKGFSLCHPEQSEGSHNVKLVLVGKEDYFYRKLEKRENKDLIFLHAVTDSDLYYLYTHSAAAVSSSLMEGFGLFPLEALGAGSVPVVSNIPSFREVCEDLAIYFNPKDANDIAEKLMKATKLKDSDREEIKKKAEEWLKKFSWRKMAQQTLAVYNQAASK